MTPYKDGIPGVDRNTWFPNLNSSSYSLSIDINTPKGREIGWKLIEWADVVAESFGPGTMKKWGLDYESVRQKKPDVVYYSTCQLSQTGPYAAYLGYGYQASALGGITYISGYPDQLPSPFQGAYTDFTAPRFGAAAIMAALDYRRRTGKEAYIDLSQMESSTHLIAPLLMDYLVNERVAERQGNRLPWAAPHGVYPCKGEDRWCAIGVFSDEEWQSFCKVAGQPWAQDGRFATFLARKRHEDELDALISGWSRNYEATELEAMLQRAGVTTSVVNSTRDLMEEDPQLKHRGYFRRFKHSVIGEHVYRGPAIKMSKTADAQFAGPCLGEHNEFVLKELLKLSDDEIAEALIEGGITTEADLPTDVASTF